MYASVAQSLLKTTKKEVCLILGPQLIGYLAIKKTYEIC